MRTEKYFYLVPNWLFRTILENPIYVLHIHLQLNKGLEQILGLFTYKPSLSWTDWSLWRMQVHFSPESSWDSNFMHVRIFCHLNGLLLLRISHLKIKFKIFLLIKFCRLTFFQKLTIHHEWWQNKKRNLENVDLFKSAFNVPFFKVVNEL